MHHLSVLSARIPFIAYLPVPSSLHLWHEPIREGGFLSPGMNFCSAMDGNSAG